MFHCFSGKFDGNNDIKQNINNFSDVLYEWIYRRMYMYKAVYNTYC